MTRQSTGGLISLGAVMAATAFIAVGCGGAATTPTTEPPNAVTTVSPVVETGAEAPAVGDIAEASIRLDTECRNGGTTEAFGLVWNIIELAPAEWYRLESLDGEVEFETLERSYFTAAGETVAISHSVEVVAECVGWEQVTFTSVTIDTFEVEGDSTLALLLDACEPNITTADVVETNDTVEITLVKSSPPPTTNAAGEANSSPDCSGVLRVTLDKPLGDRAVIDANTGQTIEGS